MIDVGVELRNRVAARLGGELSDFFQKLRQDPPAVGDALAVPLDTSFSATNKIGSIGRMLLDSDPPVIKVGPLEIDREPKYVVDSRTGIEWGVAFTHDRRTVESGAQLVREVVWPKPVRVDNLNRKHFELSLFNHMRKVFRQPVTLINPTPSTIRALSKSGGGFATITNRSQPDVIADFKALLKDLRNPNVLWKDPGDYAGTLTYLGSGEPKEFIGQWFRAVPSPFSSVFARSAVELGTPGSRRWTGTEVRGREESRSVTFYWGESDPSYSYNSVTVNKNLYCGFGWLLQSSFDLHLVEEEDERIISCPLYLDNRLTEIKDVGGRLFTVYKGTQEVFDVEGVGTYLSRRSRTMLPEGYTWARFRHNPTGVYVSSLSNHPIRDSSVRCVVVGTKEERSEFIGIGHSVPFINPVLVEIQAKAGEVIQEYPRIVAKDGVNTLWKGHIPENTWKGHRFREVLLPDDLKPGAFAFQHDRNLSRDLVGQTRRVLSVKLSGTRYIFLNGYERGQNWTVVPSELTLYMVTTMKKFFLDGVPAMSSSSLGFKGRGIIPIHEVTNKYEIRSWDDEGFSMSQIHRELPTYSFSGIVQNVSSSRDILSLENGTYVDLRKISVPFPGQERPGYYDGKKVSTLLELLAMDEKATVKFFLFPDSQFLDMCRNNGIIYSFLIAEEGYDFVFRWPRFYKDEKKFQLQSVVEYFGD